ncbi:putative porin [Gallaecimonas pentaromativorans]|uniref:putative porin n=1 Tax=Gallaecimonas pentaromativorans TaxID=584787 RepID=UPI003A94ADE6
MQKSRIVNALLFSLISLPALADNYSTELNIGRSEYNGQSDDNSWQLALTRYLSPVSTDNGPYGVNAFLSHSGYFKLSGSQSDQLDRYNISARTINSDDWLMGAGASDNNPQGNSRSHSYYLEAGRYLDDATLATFYYHRLEGGPVNADTFGATLSRYLGSSESGLWTQADISRINGSQGLDAFVVAGHSQLFLAKNWSVGAGLTYVHSDNQQLVRLIKGVQKTRYEVSSRYWFAPQASVGLTMSMEEGDGAAWQLDLGYRL